MNAKLITLIFLIGVSVINIILNVKVKSAAKTELTLLANIFSKDFLFAFLIGFCSIICMLQVYRSDLQTAQGILLMGTVSIIGGTLYLVLVKKQNISNFEWLIFFVLLLLFAVRWYLSFQPKEI
ncbi:MAG: hypothetical protein WAT79_04415 [Saprospiraceae bacterium]